MELVWSMPIHLLSVSDPRTHNDAVMCHKEWRQTVLPQLARVSHKSAPLFLELAQEFEAEHISAAAACRQAAAQLEQKDSSKSKGKPGQSTSQSNSRIDDSDEESLVAKVKCRCHRKPCTCGAKSSNASAVAATSAVEPAPSLKRARASADEVGNSDDKQQPRQPDPVFDSADDVLLARDDSVLQLCKDALDFLMKHRRSEFFLAPGSRFVPYRAAWALRRDHSFLSAVYICMFLSAVCICMFCFELDSLY